MDALTQARHAIWFDKYRPTTVGDVVLPEHIKQTFQGYVHDGFVPNVLLVGPQGIGKTSVALATLKEIGAEYIVINGSKDGNIDTLRTTIQQFASTTSMISDRKYVLLDEADFLTHATQGALRNFMEEFAKNCSFILTANYPQRILKELRSRVAIIDFKITQADRAVLAPQILKTLMTMLEQEHVNYDRAVVAQLVKRHFGDWRRVINELQRAAQQGAIDTGVLQNNTDANLSELVGHLKSRDFTSTRKWIAEHVDMEPHVLFTTLYEHLTPLLTPTSVPVMVMTLADYQYKSAFVVDQQINTAAALAVIMSEAQWL